MSDRNTYLLLHESDLRAQGEALAETLHEHLCSEITKGIDEAVEDFVSDPEDRDLVIPSLRCHLHDTLAALNRKASSGWADVFFTNLNEKYNNGGEV